MAELLTASGLFTLLMLILLQAVLGFDNLLYITIEAKRAGPENARKVTRWGIGLAVVFRIILLALIVHLFAVLAEPLFDIALNGLIEAEVSVQSLVTFIGGGFIVYTATKEIHHLLTVQEIGEHAKKPNTSVLRSVVLIVAMNVVFSFDSILSAMAIANVKEEINGEVVIRYQIAIMAVAIILSGIAMILLADYVGEFLKRNRMYEVLGLFILFLVGVLLVTEGAHLAHLRLFGYEIHAMEKSSFYLVIAVLVITDIIQTRFQKQLWAQREAELKAPGIINPAE